MREYTCDFNFEAHIRNLTVEAEFTDEIIEKISEAIDQAFEDLSNGGYVTFSEITELEYDQQYKNLEVEVADVEYHFAEKHPDLPTTFKFTISDFDEKSDCLEDIIADKIIDATDEDPLTFDYRVISETEI